MVQGCLDIVGRRRVQGWAMDADGRPVRLVASVNGEELLRSTPNLLRPDLRDRSPHPVAFNLDFGRTLQVGDEIAITTEAGEHLDNSPRVVEPEAMGRTEKALFGLWPSMKILEIGPSYNPLAPRSRGWNSFSLDHASQEELKAKYEGQQAAENIEPVDFIWTGGPVDSAVPGEHHGTFDVIIASHVIEHFPDPIGFYLSAAKLLKPDGLVSLVVPDKRVTFDFFKQVSLTSDLLSAHHERRTRHTRKTAFDNVAYNAFSRGQVAWEFRAFDQFSFPGGHDLLAAAKATFDQTVTDESGAYSDFHNTIYTPASYALTMLELGQLGLVPFRVIRSFPTAGCEFFVMLQVGEVPALAPDKLMAERFRLMKAMVAEQGEQARWLSED